MNKTSFSFLDGGGEMAALIRDFAWEKTPLGPLETWPSVLRTTISFILRSPVPLVTLWGELGIMIYNDAYSCFAGQRHPSLLGSEVRKGWGEIADWNDNVMKVGLAGGTLSFRDQALMLNRKGQPEEVTMDLDYSPITDDAGTPVGVVAIVVETSEKVAAQKALQQQEEFLRLATDAAEIGTWDLDLITGVLTWDARCKALFGLPPDAAVTYEGTFVAGLHPDDRERTVAAVQAATTPGSTGSYDVEYRTIGLADGIERWVAATGRTFFTDGKPTRFLGTIRDITSRERAQIELAEEKRALDLLNSTAARLGAELDLGRLVQTVVDAGVAFCGAQFGAFFYNVVDTKGESYMLYALSGVDPSNFSKFPMPRNTAVFAPTFSGEGIVRSGDITKDPRYGHNAPRKGMPEGHLPVRSYLAVPVVSRSGEVLGGLFFGHEKTEMFDAKSERLMTGLAAQGAIAIDNARLLQAEQRLNQTLETRVQERTEALVNAQQALQQAQKMEAIGRLSGGIAHDFNNLLMAVTGSLELLRKRIPNDVAILRLINNAMEGARRGVSLTQRMLAFARQQELKSENINVSRLVEGMTELLERSLGPTIIVKTEFPSSLPLVNTDPNQLESALLNLCLNARDAMHDEGEIFISARVADASNARAGLIEGDYVCLAVSDGGEGMDEETLKRATEPFFTTKGIGKGTGLGLPMVHGLAEQSGGTLVLRSRKGEGTTAEIWLPVVKTGGQISQPLPSVQHEQNQPLQRMRILAIDDDALVLMNTAEMLEDLGHQVIAVGSAREALDLLEDGNQFDLIVTDHAMPQMTGSQFAQQALRKWPKLKILLTTGYAELPSGADIGLRRLAKPFSQADLANGIRLAIS